MLDRESKREKILEGKLREIKIKLKKQQEQQEAKASDLLLRQAEKTTEEIKVQEELPKVKPSSSQGKWMNHHRGSCYSWIFLFFSQISGLIEAAENEFNQMIEEELQRRIKDQEAHEQHEKPKKSPKVHKKKIEVDGAVNDSDVDESPHEVSAVNGTQNGEHQQTNGASNGHHHENGHNGTDNET